MKQIKELEKQIQVLQMSVQNRDDIIEQNRSLQAELRKATDKIIALEKRLKKINTLPFFPYPMSPGGRKDYGEFYLISHAWFSCMTEKIGIIEVKWKSGRRCMYLGISSGITNPGMFDYNVKNIALYGQKNKRFKVDVMEFEELREKEAENERR